MKRWTAAVITMLSLASTGRAYAQEAVHGPARGSMTVIPGYWTYFGRNTETSSPSFGTYDLGGALSYNVSRLVGVEGEIGSAALLEEITPNLVSYTGNIMINSAGRWGLRGDYRLLMVRSNADAAAFFGPNTRYGQCVYGGVIINVAR